MHDGRLPSKDLVQFQRERALPQLPGLLDYTGYVVSGLSINFHLQLLMIHSSFSHPCSRVPHLITTTTSAGLKLACLMEALERVNLPYQKLGSKGKFPAAEGQPRGKPPWVLPGSFYI